MALNSILGSDASLDQWLSYIEAKSAIEKIDLGLSRIKSVAQKLNVLKPAPYIFTVAGTNGKGTTCRTLEMILLESGFTIGVYSSPHIINYTERVRINDEEPSKANVVSAFEIIENHRGDIELTYFEYSTLAALILFKQAQLDVIILEVGLGGRLDATNIIDADVAVITSIDIDHVNFLGNTRELIGAEKAGIFKQNSLAVIGEPDCPQSIIKIAKSMDIPAYYCANNSGNVFHYKKNKTSDLDNSWTFFCDDSQMQLPEPNVPMQNVATALAALHYSMFNIEPKNIINGIKKTSLAGRFQIIKTEPTVILDVAHNPHAAHYLKIKLDDFLSLKQRIGKIRLVIGMLKDKDFTSTLAQFDPDVWYFGSLGGPRGCSAEELSHSLNTDKQKLIFTDIISAYKKAISESQYNDIVLVCGSFYVVSEVLKYEQ